jgi:citrate lyase gamma subunit
MLAAAGIESYYILVNTDRGIIDPAFATGALFNHAIIAIRLPKGMTSPDFFATYDHPTLGKLLIFDPTSSQTPLGRIPDYEQEGHALLVTGTTGELIMLPAAPPAANQLRRRAKLQLSADGAISGDVEEVRTGVFASQLRYALRTMNSNERTRSIEQMVASHMASSEVRELKIENVDDPAADLVIRYRLAAPRYASRAAELTLLRPRVLGEKADVQIDLAARKQPYVTDGPSLQVDDVEIAVPPGLKLDELPPPASISIPPLAYSSSSKFDSGVLHYRREMTTRAFTVPVASLADLNRAFAKISSDERSTAVFVEK